MIKAMKQTHLVALRVPRELKERLQHLAVANRRSLNSQIIVLLEQDLINEKAETAATISAE